MGKRSKKHRGSTDPAPAESPVRMLGFHAQYACGNSTHCCRPGDWKIAVEPAVHRGILQHLADGSLQVPGDWDGDPEGLFHHAPPPQSDGITGRAEAESAVFLRANGAGDCLFLDRSGGNLCTIHAQLGIQAMPGICRTYPRQGVRRPTGVMVAVSCTCPTAVSMLFDSDGPLRIVDRPETLESGAVRIYDATALAAPKARPDTAVPWHRFEAWEQNALCALDELDQPPEAGLVRIAAQLEVSRGTPAPPGGMDATHWTRQLAALADPQTPGTHVADHLATLAPGLATARHHVSAILGIARLSNPFLKQIAGTFVHRYGLARGESGEVDMLADQERYLTAPWPTFSLPVRRYLATTLFSNRHAATADGFRSLLFASVCAASLLRMSALCLCAEEDLPLDRTRLEGAIQFTDRILNHSGSPRLGAYFDRGEDLSFTQLIRPIAP